MTCTVNLIEDQEERLWNEDWTHNQDPYLPMRYNHKFELPIQPNGHVCGTVEDFEKGPMDPMEGPPLVYNSFGIPTCCMPGNAVIGGGVGSGRPVVHYSPVGSVKGGGVGSGRPVEHYTPPITVVGGGVGDDRPLVGYFPPLFVIGGGVGSGLPIVEYTPPIEVVGGGVGSGVPTVEYTPPPPPCSAGNYCTTSFVGTLGVSYTRNICVGPPYWQWWRFPITSGTQYHVSCAEFSGSGFFGNLAQGTTCDDASFFHIQTETCYAFVAGVTGYLWIVVQHNEGVRQDFTMTVDYGACP